MILHSRNAAATPVQQRRASVGGHGELADDGDRYDPYDPEN
jgi:hypothetical protein